MSRIEAVDQQQYHCMPKGVENNSPRISRKPFRSGSIIFTMQLFPVAKGRLVDKINLSLDRVSAFAKSAPAEIDIVLLEGTKMQVKQDREKLSIFSRRNNADGSLKYYRGRSSRECGACLRGSEGGHRGRRCRRNTGVGSSSKPKQTLKRVIIP